MAAAAAPRGAFLAPEQGLWRLFQHKVATLKKFPGQWAKGA